ncbi:MAG: TetR/AcrR family transcriptional regulator [Syntrophomonas sp.]
MTKWEPKEKRIEDIVNAAIEVFLDKGYEGTSMEAIAKRAEISKGGLYHHFNSKEEILYYANDKLCEPIAIFAQSSINHPNVVEAIKSYIKNYIQYWVNHERALTFYFLTMTKALSCVDRWETYEGYYIKIQKLLTGLFERGVSEGRFLEHDTKASSIALLSALDGILVYLVMSKRLTPDEVVNLFEKTFIMPLVKR